MKNIVLVTQDRDGKDYTEQERMMIIKTILSDSAYQIVLLVVHADADKEKYSSLAGVKRVITSLELEYMDSMEGLDYDTILNCRDMQMNIESGFYRLYADYQLDKFSYYAALSFWNQFFKKNKVDIVIHTKMYHGYAYDCCDLVAKKYKVPYFHIVWIGYNRTFGVYTTDGFSPRFKLIPIFDNNCLNVQYLLESNFDKTGLRPSIEKKNLFRKLLYRIGGNLLEDFVMRLMTWNWKPRSLDRKRKKIYWSDKFIGWLSLKNTAKYVRKISCKPDYSSKYICYFMHFEPEASIQNCTILESQLVIIKMLSDALPEGWELYVKEHPAQFNVNNDDGYSYMWNVQFFKTKGFYQRIASMHGVKFINSEISSGELLKHSQAVASILGTVLLESVLQKKPVIVFSELYPVAFMRDALTIHSYDDCKNAIKKIAEGYQPEYMDADEVISKYVFKGEYVAGNILKLLDGVFFDTKILY